MKTHAQRTRRGLIIRRGMDKSVADWVALIFAAMMNYDFTPHMSHGVMPEISEMLTENRRRQEALAGEFDPVSGRNSVGRRFETTIGAKKVWLPEAMRNVAAADREKLRPLYDFPYWAATMAYIKNKGGGPDVTLVLNPPQRRLVETLEEMRLAEEPIRLILLKARQWGGSTCIQLYMAWLQLLHHTGLNSLIIAHQGSASEEIKDMFDRLMEAYPAEKLLNGEGESDPKQKKLTGVGRSGSTWRVPIRNFKIKIGTAERPDSCRGGDYSLVHLSEVGIWRSTQGKKPEDLARAAMGGVLYAPYTMIVLESTANGTGNYFHREYMEAVLGRSQFRPLFVAWYEIPQYAVSLADPAAFAAELLAGRANPNPADERSEAGEYLWQLWEKGATLEGIAWYIRERAKYSDHAQMAAEYPSDDEEAFTHSGARVFDKRHVSVLRGSCRSPEAIGEVQGDSPTGAGSLRNVRFRADSQGALKIWRMPDTRNFDGRYLVVVDVGGRSIGSDWSVAVVIDREPIARGEPPEVVAQWRGHTDIDLLAWKAARIATFYGNALLVIESNTVESYQARMEAMADADPSFLFEALKEEYPNLYMRSAPADAAGAFPTMRYGFHTNRSTKSAIINNLIEIVRENGYVERDRDCLDEFMTYEQRQNGSYGAIEGKHDDMLMTRAIGLYISRFNMERPHPAAVREPEPHRGSRRAYRCRPDLCF